MKYYNHIVILILLLTCGNSLISLRKSGVGNLIHRISLQQHYHPFRNPQLPLILNERNNRIHSSKRGSSTNYRSETSVKIKSSPSSQGFFQKILKLLPWNNASFKGQTKGILPQKLAYISTLVIIFSYLQGRPGLVRASVGLTTDSSSIAANNNFTPWQGLAIWASLFSISALLHSAESAITKLSTWKIQEFAEEEGPNSPFATLSANITKLLITILLTTTASSIYSTALFVASVNRLLPNLSLGVVTAGLTMITLFFGELLPKALAVSNSEYVARKLVPLISPYSTLLSPVTTTITFLSDLVLRMCGMRSEEDRNVSEDMLRLVVDEAQRSNEGIETGEGRMIKNVLDMQDKEVGRIMQPRVEVVAVPETYSANEILQLAVLTKYSRIPVYRTDIDHIVGIIYSKDLLDFIQQPQIPDTHFLKENFASVAETVPVSDLSKSSAPVKELIPKLADSWKSLTAKDLMDKPYFIPETMSCWNALQEMRKRRVHIAIVVDEYGGTAGLVTFEDILEEVVGEIYDEDDDREEQVDDWTIFRNSDGTFKMKAYAELDDVFEALAIERDDREEGEYSTIGGLLCSIAGRIPREGDEIIFGNYRFFVERVEDNRRIVDINVSPIFSESVEGIGAGYSNGVGAVDESNSFETESGEEKSFEDVEATSSDNEVLTEGNDTKFVEADSNSNQNNVENSSPYFSVASATNNEQLYDHGKAGNGKIRKVGAEISQEINEIQSVSSTGNNQTKDGEKSDAKTSKTLIFLDGEWVDPNSILNEETSDK